MSRYSSQSFAKVKLLNVSAIAFVTMLAFEGRGFAEENKVAKEPPQQGRATLPIPPPPPPPAAYPSPPPARYTPARAARVPTEPSDSVLRVEAVADGTAVVMTGALMEGSYAKVKRLLDATPKAKTLILNSEGGRSFEGALIANMLRKRKFNTHVENFCYSACTSILASGTIRSLSANARVGFHQSRTGASVFGGDPRIGAELGDSLSTLAYRDAGVDAAFTKRAMEVPWNTMWFPSQAELLRVRFVTQLSPNAPKFAQTAKTTRDAVRAKLLEKPFWQQVLAASQDLFEQGVDTAWGGAILKGNETGLERQARNHIISRLSDRLTDLPDLYLAELVTSLASKFSNDFKAQKAYCSSDWLRNAEFLSASESAISKEEEAQIINLLKAPVSKFELSDQVVYDTMARVFVTLGENTAIQGPGSFERANASCEDASKFFNEIALMPANERATIVRSMIRYKEIQKKNFKSIFEKF